LWLERAHPNFHPKRRQFAPKNTKNCGENGGDFGPKAGRKTNAEQTAQFAKSAQRGVPRNPVPRDQKLATTGI